MNISAPEKKQLQNSILMRALNMLMLLVISIVALRVAYSQVDVHWLEYVISILRQTHKAMGFVLIFFS